MITMENIVLFALGVGLGAVVSFLFIQWQKRIQNSHNFNELKNNENTIRQLIAEKAGLESSQKEKSDQISEHKADNQRLRNKLDQANTEIADLKASGQAQQAQLKAEGEKLEALTVQFEQQKAELKNEFKVVSEEKSDQISEHKADNQRLRNKLDQANTEIADLKASGQAQQAQLKAEGEKLEALTVQFEQQKAELKNEFKVVSEEIIKERQKVLNEQNKENVGALLKPLKEEIQGFRKRVNEVHTETVRGNTSLEGEIKKVMEIGLKMRDEATRLTSALKGDSQKRGAWGEAQLERTLQMSGLVQGDHYEKRSSFRDEFGKQKQTDYLIKLPDNKHIIIDSKVSLISYDKAISAETEPKRQLAMDEYVKSVKKHIDDLASKDYANLSGINSPSFVLMFMPIEPAYIEALKHDKSLFGYGYDKQIILLSHTTLIPILRTVSNLWKMDKSHKEAGKISEKAGDIYNSVCSVFQRFEKLGQTLNTASNHYNEVVTALAGRQGLQGKVERFTQISKKASKEMPPLRLRHFQCETAKLEVQNQNNR